MTVELENNFQPNLKPNCRKHYSIIFVSCRESWLYIQNCWFHRHSVIQLLGLRKVGHQHRRILEGPKGRLVGILNHCTWVSTRIAHKQAWCSDTVTGMFALDVGNSGSEPCTALNLTRWSVAKNGRRIFLGYIENYSTIQFPAVVASEEPNLSLS